MPEEEHVHGKKKTKERGLRLPSYMDLCLKAVDEMDILIRNFFGLATAGKQLTIENSKIVTATLRKDIENSKYRIEELEERLQNLNVSYYNH